MHLAAFNMQIKCIFMQRFCGNLAIIKRLKLSQKWPIVATRYHLDLLVFKMAARKHPGHRSRVSPRY